VTDEQIEVLLGDGSKVTSPKLIAGCCFFPAPPFLVCEFVSTRPGENPRLVHAACQRVAMAIRVYGATTGCFKQLCFPKHKGVALMLKRAGFLPVKKEVSVMWGPPFFPAGSVLVSEGVVEAPGIVAEEPEAPPDTEPAIRIAHALEDLGDAILDRVSHG